VPCAAKIPPPVDCCYGSLLLSAFDVTAATGNLWVASASGRLLLRLSRQQRSLGFLLSAFDATIQMVGQSRANGTAEGYLGSARRGQDPLFSDGLELMSRTWHRGGPFAPGFGFVFVGVTVFGFWLPSSADCSVTDDLWASSDCCFGLCSVLSQILGLSGFVCYMEGVAFRGLANPHDPPRLLFISGWLFSARWFDSWGLHLSFLVTWAFS